jgi:uracil-DNA glycosylase
MAHPLVVRYYEHIMDSSASSSSASTSSEPLSDEEAVSLSVAESIADKGWRLVVQNWLSRTGLRCLSLVAERRATVPVYPEQKDVFAALSLPLNKVRVVILGQDPYHGPGQAHGLSFSVKTGITLPPSLKNIRKELISDLGQGEGVWPSSVGTLTPWLNQGVLLWNSVLTVDEGNPNSHASFGWEDLTSLLLGTLVASKPDDPLVFIGWGKSAQNVLTRLKLGSKHIQLFSAHPSPLSAYAGFFGSKPFTKTNDHLLAHGSEPIVWTLSSSSASSLPGSEDPTTI